MTRHHPFSMFLFLLLTLCVLDASCMSYADFKSPSAAVEVEEEFREGMEDMLEEQISFGMDAIIVDFCIWHIVLPSEVVLRCIGVCRPCASLCSFGWVLPLRI